MLLFSAWRKPKPNGRTHAAGARDEGATDRTELRASVIPATAPIDRRQRGSRRNRAACARGLTALIRFRPVGAHRRNTARMSARSKRATSTRSAATSGSSPTSCEPSLGYRLRTTRRFSTRRAGAALSVGRMSRRAAVGGTSITTTRRVAFAGCCAIPAISCLVMSMMTQRSWSRQRLICAADYTP